MRACASRERFWKPCAPGSAASSKCARRNRELAILQCAKIGGFSQDIAHERPADLFEAAIGKRRIRRNHAIEHQLVGIEGGAEFSLDRTRYLVGAAGGRRRDRTNAIGNELDLF